MEVYVARQPVFRRDKKIHGYELLFRQDMSNFFSEIDGDVATSTVLSNSFITIGIETLTGSNLALINFTRDLLVRRFPLMFPNDRVVVEVLEDVEPEPEVIEACQEIHGQGYCIALDDFFYRPDLRPLIEMAGMIKFDLRANSLEEIAGWMEILPRNGVKFLAEKVETHEEFEQALEMGFDLFQGYFFSKPEIIKGRDPSAVQMNLLEIMAEANREDFGFGKLEGLIQRDVAISYKLLRYMNSAYFRRAMEVSSVRQAIVMLGETGVRRFLSLIAMGNLASGKPTELIRESIIRAKFCELIAGMNGKKAKSSELFTLGLFSLIDAIMDDTMENLMGRLPLSEGIKTALVERGGALRGQLDLAISYIKGDWPKVSEAAAALGLREEDLPPRFREALSWADTFTEGR